ncbi:MAG: hypothetical protein ABSH56_17420 [Bryobacteraceae bacterium]|jgi:hypothetical protein
MSQDLETMLRKAIDEAARYRRRTIIGSAVLAAAVWAGLLWLDYLRRTSDVKTMVLFAVAIILVGQVAPAVITWGLVAEATKSILRSIQLLSDD